MSSNQSCNQQFPAMDCPTMGHSTYFSKTLPKIVTTVSGTYLLLESSGTINSKTCPGSADLSALSYGSFEKHFLWNTSLFCSQTHSIDQELSNNPVLNDILHRNKYDKFSPDDIRKISTKVIDDDDYINHNSQYNNISISSNKITYSDELNSTCLAIKRNPYSIEEILKKPDKTIKFNNVYHNSTLTPTHKENDIEDQKSSSIDVGCIDQCEKFNSIQKRSRIRLKIYDFDV